MKSNYSRFDDNETLTLPAQYTTTELLNREDEIRLTADIRAGEAAKRALAAGTARLTPRQIRNHQQAINRGARSHDQMVMANTRLVLDQVKFHAGRGLSKNDLASEGIAGVIHAITKYDPSTGNRFSTYAMPWIRQYMSRATKNQGRMIRIPEHRLNQMSKVAKARQELELEGLPVTDEAVAICTGFTEAQIKEFDSYQKTPISLQTPVGDEGDATLGDLLVDDSTVDPTAEIEAEQMRNIVARLLASMGSQEQDVLRLRFGFGGDEPLSLREAGERLGISQERVRQVQEKAMSRLRHPMYQSLREYM